uniref:Candidate secreted effector n=1 Tax=Meloidogyne incognita TaxID=6306 RepID=A0A914L2E3_MELIC
MKARANIPKKIFLLRMSTDSVQNTSVNSFLIRFSLLVSIINVNGNLHLANVNFSTGSNNKRL